MKHGAGRVRVVSLWRLLVYGVASLLLVCGVRAETRLAIWPVDPSLEGVADLLTTDLSGEPGVALIERAEIDRIIRELGFTAASTSHDGVRLGSLVGAQGVVFLSRAGADVVVQLIAVQPGVIVNIYNYPFKEKELEWHTLLAAQVARELPRLSVSREDAMPVSVSGIRSALTDSQSLGMERDLKRLLMSRLAAEPRVYILDRERMRVLAQEKTLDLSMNEPFWASGYIVDGLINPHGVVEGTTELVLTVNRAGMPSTNYAVAGPSGDLPGLVRQAVERLMSGPLGRESSSAWNPRHEAEVYFEEAKWAQRWKLLPRMQEALEAAWALGLQSKECGLLRAQAYLLGASLSSGRGDGYYPYPSGKRLLATSMPNHLQNALLGLDSLDEFLRQFPLQGRTEGTAWIPGVIAGLETASAVLNVIYANRPIEGEAEWAHDVPLLRLRCRQMADLIEEAIHQSKAENTLHNTTLFNHNYHVELSSIEWLDNVRLRYGGLWHEDPREAAGMLQDVMRRWAARDNKESRKRLDDAIIGRSSPMPWLANWSGMPAETFTRLQVDAVRKLATPEFPRTFLYSSCLELKTVTQTEEVIEAARRALKGLVENDGWSYDHVYEWDLPSIIFRLLDQKWDPLTVAKHKAREQLAREFSRALLPIYLANSSRAYSDMLDRLVLPGVFKPEELPEIEAVWHAFARRSNLSPERAVEYEKRLGISATDVQDAPPPPVKNEPQPSPKREDCHPSALAFRFLQMPAVRDALTERSYPFEWFRVHRDGHRLWMEGGYSVDMIGVEPRFEHLLLEFDPDATGKAIVHLPAAEPPGEVLAVAEGEVFLRQGAQVQCLRLNGGRVPETLSLRGTGQMGLWKLDAGVYVFSDASIFRWDAATGKAEILAGSRRRPAQNILDDRPPYHVYAMMDGPQGTVRALVNNGFYQYDPGQKTWVELGQAKTVEAISCNRFGILCYPVGHMGARFSFLEPASSRPSVLFRTRDRNGQWQDEDAPRALPDEFPYSPGQSSGFPRDRMAAFDDEFIWVFDGPYMTEPPRAGSAMGGEWFEPKVRQMPDRDGILWRFSRTGSEVAVIPIHYPADGRKPLPMHPGRSPRMEHAWGRAPRMQGGPYSRLLATPQGLAIFESDGYWWLPRADIDAYVHRHPEVVRTDSDELDQGSSFRASSAGPTSGAIDPPRAGSLAWKALEQGQTATLHRILEAEGDPDRKDDKGATMLMRAARSANPAMVEILLAAGAEANATDPSDKSVLCYAAEGGSGQVLSMIIERSGGVGADADSGTRALQSAVQTGKSDAVRVLLEAGVQISGMNGDAVARMMQGAVSRESVEILELLLDNGADVNARTATQGTLLIEASSIRDLGTRIVELLLSHGADVTAKDVFGDSAVKAAVGSGSMAATRLLLDNGADVNGLDRFKESLLHDAIKGRNPDLVPFLLDRGADVDAADFMGFTPLHSAVRAGDAASVRLLLQAKADRNIRDRSGSTPAELAVKLGKQDMADLFEEGEQRDGGEAGEYEP